MKSLKHILLTGTAMFLTTFFTVSCTDGNDWEVDPSYDRLFSVSSQTLSVDPGINTAALEWTNTPNTDYYVIEVSKDSLTDQVEMGTSNGAIVYGEDGSITSSPDTISGLDADSKYFIRMKALSKSGKGGSNWAYYKSYSFKTDAEDIMDDDAVTVTGSTATVTWESGKDVTRLCLKANEATDSTFYELSAADKAACTYTFTGLQAKKTYVATIYNGDVKRGTAKFTTSENLPEGYDAVTISKGSDLNDILSNPSKYITKNGGNIVVVFPAGVTIDYTDEAFERTIPAAIKSIQFYGESGGERPTLKLTNVEFEGEHALARFYNLNITSDGSGYVVNQKATGHVSDLQIENCNIISVKGVIRNQSGDSQFDDIRVNNCTMDNIGEYGVARNDGGVFTNVSITNSTVTNGDMKGIVITKGASDKTIQIENCTFYNALRAGQYGVDDNKMPVKVTVKNVIFAKSDNIKATRTKKISTVTNTYTLSDFTYNTTYTWDDQTTLLNYSSTDVFVAPADGDFHIQKGLITGAGDPRWLE